MQLGYQEKIVKQGMPLKRYPSERGDLYVTYNVLFPQTLSKDQQQGNFKSLRYRHSISFCTQ
jgi:DnaJ-class molecular chaperone